MKRQKGEGQEVEIALKPETKEKAILTAKQEYCAERHEEMERHYRELRRIEERFKRECQFIEQRFEETPHA
jgi:hypothetical protein